MEEKHLCPAFKSRYEAFLFKGRMQKKKKKIFTWRKKIFIRFVCIKSNKVLMDLNRGHT